MWFRGGSSHFQRRGPKRAKIKCWPWYTYTGVFIALSSILKGGGANHILAPQSMIMAPLAPPWIRPWCDFTDKVCQQPLILPCLRWIWFLFYCKWILYVVFNTHHTWGQVGNRRFGWGQTGKKEEITAFQNAPDSYCFSQKVSWTFSWVGWAGKPSPKGRRLGPANLTECPWQLGWKRSPVQPN